MKHPVRWSLLSTLAISLAVAWLTRAADSAEFVVGAAAPTAAVGSLYLAPQVDESSPPAPPAPTF